MKYPTIPDSITAVGQISRSKKQIHLGNIPHMHPLVGVSKASHQ